MFLHPDINDPVSVDRRLSREAIQKLGAELRELFHNSEQYKSIEEMEALARKENRIVTCYYCSDEVICDTLDEAERYRSAEKFKCYDCIADNRKMPYRTYKTANALLSGPPPYTRLCPICGKKLLYWTENIITAMKKNTPCISCATTGVSRQRKVKWLRTCPDCGITIPYTNQRSYLKAESANKCCMSCTKKRIDREVAEGEVAGCRKCPECDTLITYKKKKHYLSAEQFNTLCKSCTKKKYRKADYLYKSTDT